MNSMIFCCVGSMPGVGVSFCVMNMVTPMRTGVM
jgi:hypothetical protein